MKRRLPLLFGLIVILAAPIASACMHCEWVEPCTVNPYLYGCYECLNPPEGVWGSMYCVMYQDGWCSLGNINCQGPGPWHRASAAFNKTWRVASVRVLTPGTPVRDEANPSVTVAAKRDTGQH